MKNVINKKPKSTIAVKSTRVDIFLARKPLLLCVLLLGRFISAIALGTF